MAGTGFQAKFTQSAVYFLYTSERPLRNMVVGSGLQAKLNSGFFNGVGISLNP